jgi:hypothetical protein
MFGGMNAREPVFPAEFEPTTRMFLSESSQVPVVPAREWIRGSITRVDQSGVGFATPLTGRPTVAEILLVSLVVGAARSRQGATVAFYGNSPPGRGAMLR